MLKTQQQAERIRDQYLNNQENVIVESSNNTDSRIRNEVAETIPQADSTADSTVPKRNQNILETTL